MFPSRLILISSVYRLIQYCTNTKDFMVPSMWGSVSRLYLVAIVPWHSMLSLVCAMLPILYVIRDGERFAHTTLCVSRSTNAKIHTHLNSQTDAARSCRTFEVDLVGVPAVF